ncbi:MAG: hypothetical protein AB7F41_09755 [Methylocystis sp.]|uniref:hypothetical protein n=1 Tax=Methylocystis sp. TaxID=1911079 RepID=UPI003D0E3012
MIELRRAAHPFLDRLRRSLPASAHARQPLLGYLQSRQIIGSTSPTLRIVNVFHNGHSENIMCQFTIEGDASTRTFVAPLTQIALKRTHPAARDVAKAIAPSRARPNIKIPL